MSDSISSFTDKYFSKTKEIVEKNGDCKVVYAVFIRRPVIYSPMLVLNFLKKMAKENNTEIEIQENFKEGDIVPAGEPMFYFIGKFSKVVEWETLLLQKTGVPAVTAWNAYQMCLSLPHAEFIAMGARHATGSEMDNLIAYGVSVGSKKAKESGALGFIASSTDDTAHYFGKEKGFGTMPHALIGYAGSTLKAAEYYHSTFPSEPITVLIDYFGKEVTDALEVCRAFPNLVKENKLSVRLDTHAGRYIEGLDRKKAYSIIEQKMFSAFSQYHDKEDLEIIIGAGVSVAAVFYLREELDNAGFTGVKIVASSGFNVRKCELFGKLKAPVNYVGTGSYIPSIWKETYATADIIRYDDKNLVKVGREHLYKHLKEV